MTDMGHQIYCLVLAFSNIAGEVKTTSVSIMQFAKNKSTQNFSPEIPILENLKIITNIIKTFPNVEIKRDFSLGDKVCEDLSSPDSD